MHLSLLQQSIYDARHSEGKTMAYKNLNPGDSVRFKYRDGERSAPVLRMLTFDNHVVVKFGPCGHVVNDANFIRIARRARK